MKALSRVVWLVLPVLTAMAAGETPSPAPARLEPPFSQQIIINNYPLPVPSAPTAPPAASAPAVTSAVAGSVPSVPPEETSDAEGAHSFRLKAAGGPRSSSGVGLGLNADLRFLYYFGLEANAGVGVGSRETSTELNAHAKILLPLKSPIIDFTPKFGIGYSAHKVRDSGFSGGTLMLGAEIELFHFLVAGIEYRTRLSNSQPRRAMYSTPNDATVYSHHSSSPYDSQVSEGPSLKFQQASLYGAVRASSRILLGIDYTETYLSSKRETWGSMFASYRF